jgi:hypothetical protein
MGAFHLAQSFELILLPCNTLSTLPGPTRSAALGRVRQHLSPTGLFAASLPNPSLLRRLPRQADSEIEEIFPHPVDGEPVQVISAWQRSGRHFTITWHYDHLLADGRVERVTAQVNQALLGVEEYIGEFQKAGLTVEGTYGDFDRSPYAEDSPNLIILARANLTV